MEDRGAFYKQVGEKIRAQRGKDLSQEALASAIGLTRTSISNIEKGRQRLLLHTLADIAAALNVDAASLLPDRRVAAEGVGAQTLAGLAENERVFVESAIGIKKRERGNHGRQTKEDPGIGGNNPQGGQGHGGTRSGLGNRSGKRGSNSR
jgi:transcriptional regulator with XRE-family HTH domain